METFQLRNKRAMSKSVHHPGNFRVAAIGRPISPVPTQLPDEMSDNARIKERQRIRKKLHEQLDAFDSTVERRATDVIEEYAQVAFTSDSNQDQLKAMAEHAQRANAFQKHVFDETARTLAAVDLVVADAQRKGDEVPDWFIANLDHMRTFPNALARMHMQNTTTDAVLSQLARPQFSRETKESGVIDPQSIDVDVFSVGALRDMDAFLEAWPRSNAFVDALRESISGKDGDNFHTYIAVMNSLLRQEKLKQVVETVSAELILNIEMKKTMDRERAEQAETFKDEAKRVALREDMWNAYGRDALFKEQGTNSTLVRNAVDLIYGAQFVAEKLRESGNDALDVDPKDTNTRTWQVSDEMSAEVADFSIEFLNLVQNRGVVAQRANRITELLPHSPLPTKHLQMDAWLCPLFDAMAAALDDPRRAHASYLSKNQRARALAKARRNTKSGRSEEEEGGILTRMQKIVINHMGLLNRALMKNWAALLEEILRVHHIRIPDTYLEADQTLFDHILEANKQVVALHIAMTTKEDIKKTQLGASMAVGGILDLLLQGVSLIPATAGTAGSMLAASLAASYYGGEGFLNLMSTENHVWLLLFVGIGPASRIGVSWFRAISGLFNDAQQRGRGALTIPGAARDTVNEVVTTVQWYYAVTFLLQEDFAAVLNANSTTGGAWLLAFMQTQACMATYVSVGFLAKTLITGTAKLTKGTLSWKDFDIQVVAKVTLAVAHLAFLFPGRIEEILDVVRTGSGGLVDPNAIVAGAGTLFADRLIGLADWIAPHVEALVGLTIDSQVLIRNISEFGLTVVAGARPFTFWRMAQTLASNAIFFHTMRQQWLRLVDDLIFVFNLEAAQGAQNIESLRAVFAAGILAGQRAELNVVADAYLQNEPPPSRILVVTGDVRMPDEAGVATLKDAIRKLQQVRLGIRRNGGTGDFNIDDADAEARKLGTTLVKLLDVVFDAPGRSGTIPHVQQLRQIEQTLPKGTGYTSQHLLQDRSGLNPLKALTMMLLSNENITVTQLADPLVHRLILDGIRAPPGFQNPGGLSDDQEKDMRSLFRWHKLAIFAVGFGISSGLKIFPSFLPTHWVAPELLTAIDLVQWPMLFYGERVLAEAQEEKPVIFRARDV